MIPATEKPSSFLDNHMGPFRLQVIRPFATKKGFYRSEWLPGMSDKDDVAEEAMAILTDPRDTVITVCVWSVREGQFVGIYRS